MVLRVALVWSVRVAEAFPAPETVVKDGVRYFVLKGVPGKVRVVWKDDAGKTAWGFPGGEGYLEGKGEKPLMLMNGGIFEPGYSLGYRVNIQLRGSQVLQRNWSNCGLHVNMDERG